MTEADTNILGIICSHNHLCEMVSDCVDFDDHEKNARDIVQRCKGLIEEQNLKSLFCPYVYIYSYIEHKDDFWDYEINDLDIRRVYYTWITVGFKNNLSLKKVSKETAERELRRLSLYKGPMWYVPIKRQHVKKKYDALCEGLRATAVETHAKTGCGIFVGVLDGNMNRMKKTKIYIYLDNAYTPDLYGKYYSLSCCDLQSLCPYDVDNSRVLQQTKAAETDRRALVKVDPKYVLVCPPSITMGIFYDIDIVTWVASTCAEIRKVSDVKIVVRFKPNEFTFNKNTGSRLLQIKEKIKSGPEAEVVFENEGSSVEAIRKAVCVIGFNSRILVEAFKDKVPIFCDDHCVCRSVSQASISDAVNNPKKFTNVEYETFLNKLSYSQWTLDEIRNGMFLPYLRSDRRTESLERPK